MRFVQGEQLESASCVKQSQCVSSVRLRSLDRKRGITDLENGHVNLFFGGIWALWIKASRKLAISLRLIR